MDVVILCGGLGTRIRDVTEDIPKPMIPIGHRPILWHIMKRYSSYGFNKFVLCLGHKSMVIKRYFLDYTMEESDFSITLNPQGENRIQRHPRGGGEDWTITLADTGLESMTGCRVKRIERYISGDTFMLTYGDGVADIDIGRLIKFHRDHGKIATVTAVQAPGRFGEIEVEQDHVVQFNEKPCVSRGWINGGFFVFDRRLFARLPDDPSLVLEQTPLIQLARDGQLAAYKHTGFWHPMDSSRDYRFLNDLWNAHKAPWQVGEPPVRRAAA